MNKEERNYLSQYWVGLMDGDGSIQVNHWRKKGFKYRLVIKLKNDPGRSNLELLEKIQRGVGGTVRVEKNGLWVVWVENHRKRISQIVSIFEDYPPLTKRLNSQLLFLKECMRKQCVYWYLINRGQKYNQPVCRAPFDLNKRRGWLSGFIEAEGCFTLRKSSSKTKSFSIAQKDEKELLEGINQHFGGKTKVRSVTSKKNLRSFYMLEIYTSDVLKNIVDHCTLFPLYGEKNRSFLLFSKFF